MEDLTPMIRRLWPLAVCAAILSLSVSAFCDVVGSLDLEGGDYSYTSNIWGLNDVCVPFAPGVSYPDFIFTSHRFSYLIFGGSYDALQWADWPSQVKHYLLKIDDCSWWLGVWVSGNGDINGDGDCDALVTDTKYFNYKGWDENFGVCYVLYDIGEPESGARTVLDLANPGSMAAVATITADQPQSRFGCCCEIIGDVDNDRYEEILVGESGWSPAGAAAWRERYECGRAYLFYGSSTLGATGTTAATAVALTGENRNDHFGAAVSSAGYLDDDPLATNRFVDFAIGAPWFDKSDGDTIVDNAGRVYIFLGTDSTITATHATDANMMITGESADSFFGSAIGTGDFDGDEQDDLIVGACGYDNQKGRAYVFLANSLTADSDGLVDASHADVIIEGNGMGDLLGNAVSSAGTFCDVLAAADATMVGAPGAVNGEGAFYVFDTTASRTFMHASEAFYTGKGSEAHDHFGLSVTELGDVDGDDDCDVAAVGEGSVLVHDSTNMAQAPTIECSLNSSSFSPGDTFMASIEADNQGAAAIVDVYIGIILPDGSIISIVNGELQAGFYPYVSFFFIPPGFHYGPVAILELNVPANIPSGDYIYAAAYVRPKETDVIGEVSLCPFSVDTQ